MRLEPQIQIEWRKNTLVWIIFHSFQFDSLFLPLKQFCFIVQKHRWHSNILAIVEANVTCKAATQTHSRTPQIDSIRDLIKFWDFFVFLFVFNLYIVYYYSTPLVSMQIQICDKIIIFFFFGKLHRKIPLQLFQFNIQFITLQSVLMRLVRCARCPKNICDLWSLQIHENNTDFHTHERMQTHSQCC